MRQKIRRRRRRRKAKTCSMKLTCPTLKISTKKPRYQIWKNI
jgi:hypothetical protein